MADRRASARLSGSVLRRSRVDHGGRVVPQSRRVRRPGADIRRGRRRRTTRPHHGELRTLLLGFSLYRAVSEVVRLRGDHNCSLPGDRLPAGDADCPQPEETPRPDGYTLLYAGGSIAGSRYVNANVPFDVLRDFTPISLLTAGRFVLVVHPNVPARNVKEYIALARSIQRHSALQHFVWPARRD